ncbi:hypothetical protein B0H10DRAFT_658839 [Mycena sp. CBHHK59/15]|nr:hypothetical protein B0H10DRAFT_658839 [Mycena sp. CBHHK59/15]
MHVSALRADAQATPEHIQDLLYTEFTDARTIFSLTFSERDWSKLSSPLVKDDLSLLLIRIGKSRALPPHLPTFIDAYSAIVDPFVSSTPPTSAPIWGPIVFALQPFMHSDSILEVFDDISDHLSRLVVANRRFFEETAVKRALSFIYGDIIKICLQIIASHYKDGNVAKRFSGLRGKLNRVFYALFSAARFSVGYKDVLQNPNSDGTVKPPLKALQNEFHQHAQFVADYAVGTEVRWFK